MLFAGDCTLYHKLLLLKPAPLPNIESLATIGGPICVYKYLSYPPESPEIQSSRTHQTYPLYRFYCFHFTPSLPIKPSLFTVSTASSLYPSHLPSLPFLLLPRYPSNLTSLPIEPTIFTNSTPPPYRAYCLPQEGWLSHPCATRTIAVTIGDCFGARCLCT